MIEVGNLGSVELTMKAGSALDVVNAARVSMGKRVDQMTERDVGLLRYLIVNEHTSPFRHVFLTFHLRLPIFVLRQWQKHQIGCAWNEQSGRYVEFKNSFAKMVFREQSGSVKQGSAGELSTEAQFATQAIYRQAVDFSHSAYERLLELGVCKEQARTLLPLSLMTECVWSCSLHALLHFLDLRLDGHAQKEIRDFAQAVLSEAVRDDDDLKLCVQIWLELKRKQRALAQEIKSQLGAEPINTLS